MPLQEVDTSINRVQLEVFIQLIALTFKYFVKHLVSIAQCLLSVTDLNDSFEIFKFIIIIIIITDNGQPF
jgi:hypothetical protein